MKTLNINGVNFEVKKPRKNKLSLKRTIETLERYDGRTIFECYDNPSSYKEDIYFNWVHWSLYDNISYFGVSGYNCMAFSLQGLYFDGTNYYLLSITKCNNTATLIELD